MWLITFFYYPTADSTFKAPIGNKLEYFIILAATARYPNQMRLTHWGWDTDRLYSQRLVREGVTHWLSQWEWLSRWVWLSTTTTSRSTDNLTRSDNTVICHGSSFMGKSWEKLHLCFRIRLRRPIQLLEVEHSLRFATAFHCTSPYSAIAVADWVHYFIS